MAWHAVACNPTRRRAHARIGTIAVQRQPMRGVRDSGTGFGMPHSGKRFGACQRRHAAQDAAGTGIGLAIVQRVIARHPGRVWAIGAVDQEATIFSSRQDRDGCADSTPSTGMLRA
jgi:light-regulated signal transduction histidine kinase (bacteriophytochrome)